MATATKTSSTTTAPATPSLVAVVVPEKPEGATKSWRRMITSVADTGSDAFAFVGPWLDRGVVYELPEGAAVMVVDRFGDGRWEVSLNSAGPLGLEPIKTWSLKSSLGKRVVDFTRRRLPAGAASMQATRLEAKPNRYESYCRRCRGIVAPNAGRLVDHGGRTVVTHHPGQCPPPPEIVRPNRWGGICLLCGGWVAAETGAAMRLSQPRNLDGAQYSAVHDPGCPENPIPGPPNHSAGWCADCREPVAAGEGYFDRDRRMPVHLACPAETVEVPTWIARLPRSASCWIDAGEVIRVQVALADGDPEVPVDAPGYRMLEVETGYVELVAVVLEMFTAESGTRRVRVRAASPAEAEDVLAREITLIPDVRPHPAGFKARFTAEQIGHTKPWLAEITGRTPQFGFKRRFLRADRDFSRANRRGTSGVEYAWTLTVNRVYEAEYPTSWSKARRVFLRADPAGDVVEIDEAEVIAWLDNAPVWPAA
ncbi:hypothetical protein A5637_16345 [Mycolicibacterium fortuitum]|uniref:hypothetical protein n=1 Tax=Mycolicibacterium fortuitum TaxID=1766 RepID=UPI0007ECE5E5|nr:hypothetical protein [Mycolicibacterium fortuitum]OBK02782.1 hypothetical protein A5637_16345 [Mycolicibacterium fortuitum]